jgi:hypothetical protein
MELPAACGFQSHYKNEICSVLSDFSVVYFFRTVASHLPPAKAFGSFSIFMIGNEDQ